MGRGRPQNGLLSFPRQHGQQRLESYTVGLGLPSNISVPALTTLCQGHNGYLLITGALSTDQSMRLGKYFLQILAGITKSRVFSAVVPRNSAEYDLTVVLKELNQPMFGISLTVTATCDWTLTRKDGRTVWHQTIVTPYEAKFKEAFAASVRLQRANEGAIRENIHKGIAELPAARF
jgi:hypothetical protein